MCALYSILYNIYYTLSSVVYALFYYTTVHSQSAGGSLFLFKWDELVSLKWAVTIR